MRQLLLKILIGASFAALLMGTMVQAQEKSKILAIRGGTVHTLGDKGMLTNATILIEDGKIKAVGQNITIPENADIIDATGKIIVPGFMHSGSQLGLSEISMTDDSNEHSGKGSDFSAAFDVRYGLKSNSVVIADNRRLGLTSAITQPSESDGIFYGSSAVISLTSDADMFVSKGPMVAVLANGGNRNVAWGKIRLILDQVIYYDQNRSRVMKGEGPKDFLLSHYNMDALVGVVKGKQKLVLNLDSQDDLRQAIALKRKYNLDLIISGASEAWKVADELAAAKIPVVIYPNDDLPYNFGKLGASLHNAALLEMAGVEFAIASDGMGTNHNAAQINRMAGLAVAHGVSWQRALEAITISPARIFGVEGSLGSIEKGKLAHIVLWDADPLEVTSRPDYVIVNGVNHPLVSRRTLLRDRYMGLNKKPFAYH
ncbi:MAG: amidohydrolase family protein [Emcibacter sp.]|nr:amidohydrolase family protein [Emcibacter sp.]